VGRCFNEMPWSWYNECDRTHASTLRGSAGPRRAHDAFASGGGGHDGLDVSRTLIAGVEWVSQIVMWCCGRVVV